MNTSVSASTQMSTMITPESTCLRDASKARWSPGKAEPLYGYHDGIDQTLDSMSPHMRLGDPPLVPLVLPCIPIGKVAHRRSAA